MHRQTYEAKLYTPLFYASREGNIVETDPHLSSTALSHALGYEYAEMRKDYVLIGDDATNPSYHRIGELPFLVSDMTPKSVDTTERTFRTTSYTGELNLTTSDQAVAKKLNSDGSKGVPQVRGTSDSGWHEVRHHLGLSPGSTFEFTVWSQELLPDSLRFSMGIKLTGEFKARRTTDRTTLPSLSKYVLTHGHNLTAADLREVLEHSDRFVRGNDPRLHRFEGVESEYVTNELAPKILG